MIKFKSLMQVIQQSIQSAAKAVEEQGTKHLNDYFEEVENKETDENGNSITHRPKMVAMEFPSRTPDGVETVTANIPLITLSPISTSKIAEVKFTARLEVTTDENDELYVAFPGPNKSGLFGGRPSNRRENTRIEVTLTEAEPPEGLQKVIEGYERAIRAQIPG